MQCREIPSTRRTFAFLLLAPALPASGFGQSPQNVEGFDQVTFHHSNLYIGVTCATSVGPANGYPWATMIAPDRALVVYYFNKNDGPAPSRARS